MARTPGANSKARPAKDARQRAWAAMRYIGTFTAADIMAAAEIGKDNLKKYLKALSKAGYLREVKPRRSGYAMGYAVWQVVRDTGPKHPLAWQSGQVFDQNNGETYGPDASGTGGTEVARRTAASL